MAFLSFQDGVHQYVERVPKISDKLAKGVYTVIRKQSMFEDTVEFIETDISKLPLPKEFLPTPEFDVFRNQLSHFYNDKTRTIFNDLGAKHYLGAILYGPPGTGKTVGINLITRELVQRFEEEGSNYYILIINHDNVVAVLDRVMKELGKNPEDRLIIVMEEATSHFSDNNVRNSFLRFSDGVNTPQNTFVVLTTNHPKYLPKMFFERPGRFGMVLEINFLKPQNIVEMYRRSLPEHLVNHPGFKVFESKLAAANQLTIDLAKALLIQCLTCTPEQVDQMTSSNKSLKESEVNSEYTTLPDKKENFWNKITRRKR